MSWLDDIIASQPKPPGLPGNPGWPGTPYAPSYNPTNAPALSGMLGQAGVLKPDSAQKYALDRLQNQYRSYDQNMAQWQDQARNAILSGGGGGGGGVRTIDNRPQVRDRYNAMREQAEGRYGSSRADMGQLYDQLAAAYQGLPEQAAQRFAVASEGATGQTERLMQETAARVNEEAAARAAQAAELGIDPTAMEDLTETVDYQTGEMGRTGANWSGLMGALSASEQTRGQLAYEGALDTGVMAKQDLLSRYNDYLEMLDANESQELMGAIQQVATGSGSSAPKLPASILEALFLDKFYETGILERPEPEVEPEGQFSDVPQGDIDFLLDVIAQDGNISMFLGAGGNNKAIEAAKALGYTVPSTFLQPSVSVGIPTRER
jgi:hypothetical protein